MYSGKTTELLRLSVIYFEMKLKVLYINHSFDTRSDKNFSTHNLIIGQIPFDTVKSSKLSEVDVDKYDVIAIDEAQFFDDLDVVVEWVEKKEKIVNICGLISDSNRNKFGKIIDLIPMADTVNKLCSFCLPCRENSNVINLAHFTKKIALDERLVVIGGKEAYIPVCRECYKK
jgi:thymidine kinase